MPVDALPVTDALYLQLLADQSIGAQIVPGPGGLPVAVFPAPPTEEQVLEVWRQTFEVSAFQAKAALFNRDKLAAAEAVAQAAGGLVLLAWQTAQTFQRRSPAINQMLPVIGITDPLDQDELFREAALITA
jgi:hypothetical protein